MDIANLFDRPKYNGEIERLRRLINFMEIFNYSMYQSNGQRISTPRNLIMPTPERGCEIFIGKIPRTVFEDELIPLFARIGYIYKFRLMLDFSGLNRGFGFVTYTNPFDADRAISVMHNYEIRSNRFIGVYKSIDNCRLFVGGVPVEKTRDEVLRKLEQYVDGITEIIMYPAHNLEHVNRGYVFVEFCDHKSAAMARRQLGCGFTLWNSNIAVDWADPIPEVGEEIMNRVTKLYVRNLDVKMNEFKLRRKLAAVIDDTLITKVHKIKDFAFVHFDTRENAEFAMQVLTRENIEVFWARPAKYSKFNRLNAPAENFCVSVPPRMRRIVQQHKLGQLIDTHSSMNNLSRTPGLADSGVASVLEYQLSSNFWSTNV